MKLKVRCMVCNGKGRVDGDFGCPNPTIGDQLTTKTCPGCQGTGMQEVTFDYGVGEG